MMADGAGGLGAVSFGIDENLFYLLALAVMILLIAGVWKLVKFVWAAFSG